MEPFTAKDIPNVTSGSFGTFSAIISLDLNTHCVTVWLVSGLLISTWQCVCAFHGKCVDFSPLTASTQSDLTSCDLSLFGEVKFKMKASPCNTEGDPEQVVGRAWSKEWNIHNVAVEANTLYCGTSWLLWRDWWWEFNMVELLRFFISVVLVHYDHTYFPCSKKNHSYDCIRVVSIYWCVLYSKQQEMRVRVEHLVWLGFPHCCHSS